MVDIDSEVKYEWKAFNCVPMSQFDIDKKNIKTIQAEIDKIPKESKVKLVFTLEGYSLKMLREANELVKNNKKKFVEFVYVFNSIYKEIEMEEVNREKDKTIPQLLEEFCTKEKVDVSIKKMLLEMT